MQLTVLPEDVGRRLDQFLAAALPDRSRSEVQRWVREGRVVVAAAAGDLPVGDLPVGDLPVGDLPVGDLPVGDLPVGDLPVSEVKVSLRLEAGMRVVVELPGAPVVVPDLAAEAIALRIVYEDADLIVVDKPAGMVVHPAPGHEAGTLVNAILHHDPGIEGVGGERRPGIVHRLDRETSGLIVVARNDRAHRALQAQFKARTVFKEYLALVEGGVDPPAGMISAPVGRHPVDRKRQAVLPEDARTGESAGREALTEYHTLARYVAPPSLVQGGAGRMTFTLLRVVLHTGRTHQIRVHLAWRKHAVVGDTLYGPDVARLPIRRQFLHAHRLRLRIPASGEEREFVSPLPEDLQRLLDRLAAAG